MSIPNLIKYLSQFKQIMDDQKVRYKEPSWPWYSIHRPRDKSIFESKSKVLVPYRSKSNNFAFSEEPVFSSRDVFYLTPKSSEKTIVKNTLLILNSRLCLFWLKHKGKVKGDTLELYATPLSEIPIKVFNKSQNISSYLLALLLNAKVVDKSIPNAHIAKIFEDVIDALVFELYFPEDFAEKGIEIEKHAQVIFKSIEGLSEEEQIKSIQEAYQTLQKEGNLLGNAIKLMKVELKELLLPILSV